MKLYLLALTAAFGLQSACAGSDHRAHTGYKIKGHAKAAVSGASEVQDKPDQKPVQESGDTVSRSQLEINDSADKDAADLPMDETK